MHRAKSVLTWGACGLIGLGLVVRAAAQQPQPESVPMPVPAAAPTKAGNALVVAINGTKRLSMNSKRPIRFVNNEKKRSLAFRPFRTTRPPSWSSASRPARPPCA